jgi:tetratricopeptide (TPR) repeat protein
MGASGRLQATIFLIHKVFGKWGAVLDTPAPAHGSPYLEGLWHYVRGSAFVRRREFDKAQIELRKLKEAEGDPTVKDLLATANPARRVLQLATLGLEGEIALAQGLFATAIASFEAAVRIQDEMLYIEPPDWGQSMRLYLGNALLKARRPRVAERVYRDDLKEFRENGWALYGLWQSLDAQGKKREARRVRTKFDQAWKGADVTLRASIF